VSLLASGEVYNIGTDSERTVMDVARDIAKRFNMDVGKIVSVKDRAFNDRSDGTCCACSSGLAAVAYCAWGERGYDGQRSLSPSLL